MKLVILVPSRDYMDNAGARIRYTRLSEALADLGFDLLMIEISAFDAAKAACDVVIVSKCYDARALLAAALLNRRGIPVGLDVFDDYFSQSSDSRLGRLRSWLRQMLRFASFVLCSTPAVAERIERYRGDLPIHVLNDPAPVMPVASIAAELERKMRSAKSEGVLRLAWFGVGDNPYYPVGLSDLASFADALVPFADRNVPIHLTVLTNKRALSADGLARLAQFPIQLDVDEWSEDKEAELLGSAMACFLPVNAQPFSTAKSLNRALTALTAGCQVLTAGYPLYQRLDSIIYSDAGSLIDDFERNEMRLSPGRLEKFESLVRTLGSIPGEAAALAEFLRSSISKGGKPADQEQLFLLHGLASNRSAHDRARASGILTVALPFMTMPLECDVLVRLARDGAPYLMVSDKAFGRVRAKARSDAEAEHKIGRRKFRQIGGVEGAKSAKKDARSLPSQLALYVPVYERTLGLLVEAFGPGRAILSENSQLPPEIVN